MPAYAEYVCVGDAGDGQGVQGAEAHLEAEEAPLWWTHAPAEPGRNTIGSEDVLLFDVDVGFWWGD